MSEKCTHRHTHPVFDTETGEGYTRCADCGEVVEDMMRPRSTKPPCEVQDTVAATREVESIDIPMFTTEDTKAIATLPLALIKPVVTAAQFEALTKFVSINRMVTGLNDQGKKNFDA